MSISTCQFSIHVAINVCTACRYAALHGVYMYSEALWGVGGGGVCFLLVVGFIIPVLVLVTIFLHYL